MFKTKVIMDVDTGIDDALAIILADSFDTIEICGISTVVGNTSLDNATENTAFILEHLKLDVPFAKGSALPLNGIKVDEGTAHGSDGLGGVLSKKPTKREYVDLFEMYENILRQNEKISIIATGPLTNIAKIMLAYPRFKDKIEKISIMGGAIHMGNRTATTEFNIIADPEAAQIVFASGVPIVLAPLDVTYQSFITKKDIQALRESIHPDHRSLIEMLYVYIDGYQQRTFLEGSPLHDSVAVAALVHPEIFTTREAYVEVDYSESYTRGTTLVDGLNNLKLNSNATILETIDREAFLRMTLRSFERFKHA